MATHADKIFEKTSNMNKTQKVQVNNKPIRNGKNVIHNRDIIN